MYNLRRKKINMFKVQNLQGFRDFLPKEKRQRDFVVKKVIEVFERFGFEPLETPTLEYASLLLGKYGKEADKLVYKFTDQGGREVALRYDQTVPTARILTQYQYVLPKYFRRYQIQNVFRAEKPQKGRFREFTQCDIDIFGSTSQMADAEIIACTYFAFKNIGYPNIRIKINDRRILFDTLIEFATSTVSIMSIIQTIDKLDRINENGVIDELQKKGLSPETAKNALNTIRTVKPTDILQKVMSYSLALGVPQKALQFEPAIARGLDYYTGMIFEVFVPEYNLGKSSLGGGGRYDKLIEQLGGVNIPAVGIAFGFDRMVEAARELQLIPGEKSTTCVLVTVFNESVQDICLELTAKLRTDNIKTEIFLNSAEKLDKQLKYADKKGIPYVVIIGPDEAKNNKVKLRNMQTREEQLLSTEQLVDRLT